MLVNQADAVQIENRLYYTNHKILVSRIFFVLEIYTAFRGKYGAIQG